MGVFSRQSDGILTFPAAKLNGDRVVVFKERSPLSFHLKTILDKQFHLRFKNAGLLLHFSKVTKFILSHVELKGAKIAIALGLTSIFVPVKKRVLYAGLNWGLGHATRSVPIIESLLSFGAEVEITSSGLALSYLKKRFPTLVSHNLPDTEVRYSKKGAKSGLIKRAFAQSSINSLQHRFVSKLVDHREITLIVSDNVYGAFSSRIPSALVSHQLSLKAPFAEKVINAKLATWINRFSEVWIPDVASHLLSGHLATNNKVTIPKKYLGIPSRFVLDHTAQKKYRIGVLLGGPEPQRSILEKELLKILESIDGKKILFRGCETADEILDETIEVTLLGDGKEMGSKLAACDLVIGRSGYSTICDLMAVGTKALLIPTPGQSEQEYLAFRMRVQPQFSTCSQAKLDLERVKRALNKGFQSNDRFDIFKSNSQVVRAFLEQ